MERSQKVFYSPLKLLVLLWVASPMYYCLQITAVEGYSQNVNILCDLDRDAHPLYWRIQGRVYELYNVPAIFIVRDYEALTLATVDRRMDGWRLHCFFIDDNGATVLGLESTLNIWYNRSTGGPGNADLLQSSSVGRVVLNYQDLQFATETFILSWFYSTMDVTAHCSSCEYEVAVFNGTEISQRSRTNLTPLMTFRTNRSRIAIESRYLKDSNYFRINLLAQRLNVSMSQATSAYYYNVSYSGDIQNINAQGDVATFRMPEYLRNRQSVQLIWSKDDDTRCICPPLEELILQCACNVENLSSNVINMTDYDITISNLTQIRGEEQLMLYFVHSVSNGCMNNCNLRSTEAIYRITQGYPQPPVVNITSTGTFCFTIPDNPTAPEVYEVNLTDSTGVLTRLGGVYNTSACLNVTSDLYPDVCSPFQLFIAAVNRVGREVREKSMFLDGAMKAAPCDCYKKKANLTIASSNLTPTSVELTLHCKYLYFMEIIINSTGKADQETTLSCNSMEKMSSLTPATNYSVQTVPNDSRLSCLLYQFKTSPESDNKKGLSHVMVIVLACVGAVLVLATMGISFRVCIYCKKLRKKHRTKEALRTIAS